MQSSIVETYHELVVIPGAKGNAMNSSSNEMDGSPQGMIRIALRTNCVLRAATRPDEKTIRNCVLALAKVFCWGRE